jgi:hypothetical protein
MDLEEKRKLEKVEERVNQQFGLVQSIHETLHSDFGVLKILQEIKVQTTKTNGRVSKLENWQAAVIGVTAILSIMVPAISWYFIQKIDVINDKVLIHMYSNK